MIRRGFFGALGGLFGAGTARAATAQPTPAPATLHPIRVWKLGDHTRDIYPTEAVVKRFSEMLAQADGGPSDLIWGSALQVELVGEGLHVVAGPGVTLAREGAVVRAVRSDGVSDRQD